MKLPKAELICANNTYGLRRGEIEISEISEDSVLVQNIINAINLAGDVSDLHLQDIVDDFTH